MVKKAHSPPNELLKTGNESANDNKKSLNESFAHEESMTVDIQYIRSTLEFPPVFIFPDPEFGG